MATDLSLIVVTRNRASALAECLCSIATAVSTCPRCAVEILVVDNGSADATSEILEDWGKKSAVRFIHLRERIPGASRAKNKALEAASGRILAFTDDDCCLSQDYVTNLISAYGVDEGPVVRGGRVELGDKKDIPFTTKADLRPDRYRPPTHPGGFVHGCNLTFSRRVPQMLGNFDVDFGPGAAIGAAEDTDYVIRAYNAGIPVLYDPRLVVFHHHGRRKVEEIARLHHLYNVGNGALYIKHGLKRPELLRHFYWDLRNGFMEYLGGPAFNKELNLSHRGKVMGNLRGVWHYVRLRLLRS